MSNVWEGVFSAMYDPLLWVGERAGMAKHREDLLSQASGRVLELGAGTGLNLPHYPDVIRDLTLTEPAAPMLAAAARANGPGTSTRNCRRPRPPEFA